MLIYIIIIIISVFFAFLAQCLKKNITKNKKIKIEYIICCILSFLPPFLVASFRAYTIGTDTSGTYLSIYNLVLNGLGSGIRDSGFAMLNQIAILLFNSYTGVLIITSLIMYVCFYKSIFHQSASPSLSTYLFFATNVYFISMNMIRQSISISLFTLAIPYIKKRKLIKFVILELLAISMHSSAIVYLPTYFILKKQLNIKNAIILISIFVLFGGILSKYIIELLCRSPYFLKYFSWYLTSKFNTHSINLFSLLIALCIFILLIIINKQAKNDKDYNSLLWLQTLAILSLTISSYIPLMQRISWLFSFPLFIYLPKMFSYIKKEKLRILIKTITLSGYTLYMIITIFIMRYHEVVPYISIFS